MFCIYCGAEMHNKGKFCPQCGKPVASAEKATHAEDVISAEENDSAEEITTVEEIAPVEETDFTEEVTPVEETASVEGTDSAEEVTTVEETASVEKTDSAEEVTTVEEVVSMDGETTVEEKITQKNGLAKKNLTAVTTYIISALLVAGLGFFAVPKYIFHSAFEKTAKSSSPEAALTLYKAADNSTAVSDIKFAIAKNALEIENYAYAAAIFAELKNQDYATEDIASYVDEAFAGRCRILVNGGKYNLAAADSTQISDPLLRASIVNDALISKAKILSAEGKNNEAYEMLTGINISAAYDSESYNIIVYNYAVGFYNEMKFAETYKILANATDEASVELRCASAYYMANDYLNAKNYEKAIEMYEKAKSFSDSEDRLKQCSYQLGLRYYNMNKLDTALEYFTSADGYKEAASYIKKIEEKKAYMGWMIDGFTTDYVNTITGRPNPEKTRIALTDPFIYYFTITNVNNNTNGITINIKITTPDGQTADETFTDVKNGDVNCYIAGYELPQYGALGQAYFTVTIVETGEVLDTCYFEIY